MAQEKEISCNDCPGCETVVNDSSDCGSPASAPDTGRCAKCSRTPGNGCGAMDRCNKVPRGKMNCYNWMADMPHSPEDQEIVQVQFKNTRKGFYRNSLHLPLKEGDIVAVEASPGHDIGEVTMTGPLVAVQMRHTRQVNEDDIKRVFRLAKPSDLDKYAKAKAREHETMIKSRVIAKELALDMKIGDVEYQGDGGKAIFYYIADGRVDFRKLIRVLADTFHVKIEMKQIGARQEAGRIGGIGPCGRPLCCATWMSTFNSVGTSAARFQDISMNPQKLAGQCAKLKCCLNYEVDIYMEAQKKLPARDVTLETKEATYYHFKTDILKREITYSTDKKMPVNCVTIPARRAFEIIALNKQGVKVDSLEEKGTPRKVAASEFVEIVGQDNINRFDKKKNKKKRKPTIEKDNNRKPRPADAENTGKDRPVRTNVEKRSKQPRQPRPAGNQENRATNADRQQPENRQSKPDNNKNSGKTD